MPVAGLSFPCDHKNQIFLKVASRRQLQASNSEGSWFTLLAWSFVDLNGVIHVLGLHLNEPRQSNLQNRQGWNVNTPNPNKNQKMVVCSKTRELTCLKREKGKEHTWILSLREQWLQLLYSLLNWCLKLNRYEELQLRYCISNCSILKNIRIWCR